MLLCSCPDCGQTQLADPGTECNFCLGALSPVADWQCPRCNSDVRSDQGPGVPPSSSCQADEQGRPCGFEGVDWKPRFPECPVDRELRTMRAPLLAVSIVGGFITPGEMRAAAVELLRIVRAASREQQGVELDYLLLFRAFWGAKELRERIAREQEPDEPQRLGRDLHFHLPCERSDGRCFDSPRCLMGPFCGFLVKREVDRAARFLEKYRGISLANAGVWIPSTQELLDSMARALDLSRWALREWRQFPRQSVSAEGERLSSCFTGSHQYVEQPALGFEE